MTDTITEALAPEATPRPTFTEALLNFDTSPLTAPTDEEISAARNAFEAAQRQARTTTDALARLDTEIEAARKALQPRTDLAELLAGLTRVDIESRVRQLALPKDHAKNMAGVRAALAESEALRLESEALLPELERFHSEMRAAKKAAREDADSATYKLGEMLQLRAKVERYIPVLATLLGIEAEIHAIAEEHGIGKACRTAFTLDGATISSLNPGLSVGEVVKHIDAMACGAWPPKAVVPTSGNPPDRKDVKP